MSPPCQQFGMGDSVHHQRRPLSRRQVTELPRRRVRSDGAKPAFGTLGARLHAQLPGISGKSRPWPWRSATRRVAGSGSDPYCDHGGPGLDTNPVETQIRTVATRCSSYPLFQVSGNIGLWFSASTRHGRPFRSVASVIRSPSRSAARIGLGAPGTTWSASGIRSVIRRRTA